MNNEALAMFWLIVLAAGWVWLARRMTRPPLPPVGHAYVPKNALLRFLRLERRRKR